MANYKTGKLLEQVQIPKDLREKISEDDLPKLCEELREFIGSDEASSFRIIPLPYKIKASDCFTAHLQTFFSCRCIKAFKNNSNE